MIVRNFGLRQGRRALAAPLSQACLRTVTTSSSSGPTRPAAPAPTTVAEPPPAPTPTPNTPTSYSQAFAAAQAAARKAAIAHIPANHQEYERQRGLTRPLGSNVESRYHPDQDLENPPHDVTLEMLMAAQSHMGHHVSQWNPANQRYIYGVRQDIHIINLETTAAHLRRAAKVVEEVAYHGGLILFVGTRRGQMPAVVKAAELAKGCHLYQKWVPGSITNRDVILANKRLKVVDELDRELKGFDEHIRDCRPVVPDLVVCFNPIENYPLLHECGLAAIPTIGVIDTDADPTWVTYQIPANDDSIRCITLIAAVLGRAGERGQARRLADANEGIVTWETPREVANFIERDAREKAKAAKQAVDEAKASGELSDKPPLTREEFLSDDQLLAEMLEAPIISKPSPSEEV